mgnify:CR=1 FL=1
MAYLIKNINVINEGEVFSSDVLLDGQLIPLHSIAIPTRSTRSITFSPPPPSLRFLMHSGQEVTI